MPKTLTTPAGKVRKYKVTEGIHYHGERVWTKGMVIASRLPLTEMLVNKFEEVHGDTPADKGIPEFKYEQEGVRKMPSSAIQRKSMSVDPEEGLDDAPEADAPKEDKKFSFLQGAADVTDMFPFVQQEAVGLQVLQNGNKYGVVSADNPRELLNTAGPLKKSEVEKWVEKYLDE